MNQRTIQYIPTLDGIRAYAVLMVCVFHFFMVNESGLYETNKILGIALFKTAELGQKGVELFFLLSGFLITNILMETKESPKYFTVFYIRRFLRIFPLYYFVLFISFIILPGLYTPDADAQTIIDKQVWLWTYTANLSGFWGEGGWDAGSNFPWFVHFWSLCVEEHFYLFWPLLIFLSSEKWLPKIMFMVILFSVFSILLNSFGYSSKFFGISSINYAGILSLGGLIAYHKMDPERFENINKFALKFILPAGILFLVSNFTPRRFQVHEILTLFSSVVFFSMLMIITLKGHKLTDQLFNHRKLFFIGKISYGIYVYHGLLVPFLKTYFYDGFLSKVSNPIFSTIVYTIICTTLAIILAWISWEILESQLLKLKKVFKY
jgi:peptidoglycan/LPS O-acetylase OafA/YrhL